MTSDPLYCYNYPMLAVLGPESCPPPTVPLEPCQEPQSAPQVLSSGSPPASPASSPVPALDGRSLALLRTITGLSRRQTAFLVGVSVNVYCLYERGKVRIPVERIPHILSILLPLAEANASSYASIRERFLCDSVKTKD